MTTWQVDVVIAAHDPGRAIDRAVASVLDHNEASVRVTVVAHNTPADGIAQALGTYATHPSVRIIPLADGIRSPSGPFNAGLDAATAPFRMVMGSDDSLEPGAVDAWVARAQKDDADMVIARVRHASGPAIATPPTRLGRTRALDGRRDRLSYRSAPLGLLRAQRFGELRFTEGVAVGEDVAFVTAMWFGDAHLSYARRSPAYLVHDDASERTTHSSRPVVDELAFVTALIDSGLFARLSPAERTSVATKLMRIHVFGVVVNRPDASWWTPTERASLAEIATSVMSVAGVGAVLSRNDHALLRTMADVGAPVEELFAASAQRRRFATPASVATVRLRDMFRADAPLRYALATVAQSRG